MQQNWFGAGLVVRASTLLLGGVIAAGFMAAGIQQAQAGFTSYTIRNSPTINDLGSGVTEIITASGGDKAALGSNDIDGNTIGDINNLSIDRIDDVSRFAAGSGPAVAPYLNFWITDGAGNYAVAANEPSNPAFQPLFDDGYDLSYDLLSDKVVKIYENSDTSWLPNSGTNLTFADLSSFVIQAPSIAALNTGWSGLGTGAPRDGSNNAYGVNWVFGDTLSNYVSGEPGYRVTNAAVSVTAVPNPAPTVLLAIGLLALAAIGYRQRSSGCTKQHRVRASG